MNEFPRPELLLHPNIPKPLHGINPRSILGQDWWDIVRKEAYAKYDFHCWACGIHKSEAKYHQWLEGHENYKINYKTGCVKLVEVVALCHSCHNFIHDGRLKHLLDSGEISYNKYHDILNHGYKVLSDNNLNKQKYLDRLQRSAKAFWNDYYLLLEGKKYYSKFKDHYEWYDYYNK